MVHYKVSIKWPKVVTTQVDADVDLSPFSLSVNNKGYIQFLGQGQTGMLHRYVMGLSRGDKRQVDHINNEKTDNRRCNLRIVSCKENNRFKGIIKSNKTGMVGVIRLKNGRYVARLQSRENGKKHLVH